MLSAAPLLLWVTCGNVELCPFAVGHVPSRSFILGEGLSPETLGVAQPRPRAQASLVRRGARLGSAPTVVWLVADLLGGQRDGWISACCRRPAFSALSAAVPAQGAACEPPTSVVKPPQGLDAGLLCWWRACLLETGAAREGGPEGFPFDFQN